MNERKKAKSIVEQLDFLNKRYAATMEALGNLDEYVGAIADLVGRDLVEEALRAARKRKEEAEAAENEASLADGKEHGYLVATESFPGDGGVLVVSETSQDGKTYPREFVFVNKLLKEYRDLLSTKSVGDEVPFPNGATVKILEAYRVDADKYVERRRTLAAKKAEEASEVPPGEGGTADETAEPAKESLGE